MFEENYSDNPLGDRLEGWVWWPEDQLEDICCCKGKSQQKTQRVNTTLASDFTADWPKIVNR